jgi:hypothetical protein
MCERVGVVGRRSEVLRSAMAAWTRGSSWLPPPFRGVERGDRRAGWVGLLPSPVESVSLPPAGREGRHSGPIFFFFFHEKQTGGMCEERLRAWGSPVVGEAESI